MVKEKRAVTVLEVRSYEFLLRTVTALFFSLVYFYYTTTIFMLGEGEEFPLRTGAISLFSSTTMPMPVLFMWGERAGEFLLHTITALFFTCLFLLHYYYFYVGRGRGIRKTLPLQHCSLPRIYKYHRIQEEPHSLRRRNSSDPPLRHALLPAESLQLL